MKIPTKVFKFLEQQKIKYEVLEHRTVFTAHDKAATLKIPEKMVGKTLVVKLNRELVIVLIPADKNLNKIKIKQAANDYRRKIGQKLIKNVYFAKEAVIRNHLKGVKVGAIPPFGGLWKIATYCDKALLNNTKIIINSGDYRGSLKITPSVLKKLAPDLVIGNFTASR